MEAITVLGIHGSMLADCLLAAKTPMVVKENATGNPRYN